MRGSGKGRERENQGGGEEKFVVDILSPPPFVFSWNEKHNMRLFSLSLWENEGENEGRKRRNDKREREKRP